MDERGKAARYEKQLKTVASRVAPILNAYSAKNGLGATVTPKEIVVTHIAEGAALLLSTDFYLVDNVHPVSGVGLDDYRRGFKMYTELVREIDLTFKSRLAAIADNPERPKANAVLGCGAGRRLVWSTIREYFLPMSAQGRSWLLKRLHISSISEKSAPKRPKLAVMSSEAADALLARGDPLPHQPTSWNAVYHILQRYGAWVALTEFSNAFTLDGEINDAK